MAKELWEFCLLHNIRLRAIHRAGVDNVRADQLSRVKYDPTGYRLRPEVFRHINRQFGPHTIDLMADRLNTQLRWADWVERPIQLYESQRTLFQLRSGRIEPLLLTEPRDKELNQLGWWQRQVALLLEARDALAPQVQALVRRIGDLAVILLTQVLGRAIGLVGRGIAQGMGRSFGRG